MVAPTRGGGGSISGGRVIEGVFGTVSDSERLAEPDAVILAVAVARIDLVWVADVESVALSVMVEDIDSVPVAVVESVVLSVTVDEIDPVAVDEAERL